MPIPKPNPNEDNQKFVARCMGNETMKKDYPDQKQRVAICLGQTKKKSKGIFSQVMDILGFSMDYNDCEQCGDSYEIASYDMYIPSEEEYVDFGEETEEFEVKAAKFEYMHPTTRELFYFDKLRDYKKDGIKLIYQGQASEYQGRKVTLNKPFRTPNGPKKFSVYVKNEKGNVVKVNFGDPNMKIKKNIPERRKSFRARHHCENPGPKWKARYWSCKAW